MTTTELELKNMDVFSFRFNAEYVKKESYPYHCFDGTLIAKKFHDGKIRLVDTYWTSDSRVFTLSDALKKGTLNFICNLDEVTAATKDIYNYYNDEDCITLFIHAGYRNQYYLKRGAERSKEKMISVLTSKIEDANRQIESLKWYANNYAVSIEEINSGNLSIHI